MIFLDSFEFAAFCLVLNQAPQQKAQSDQTLLARLAEVLDCDRVASTDAALALVQVVSR